MSSWQGILHPISDGDISKLSPEWLQTHIQKGPLGDVYPIPIHIAEGDTPTLLYHVQSGLGVHERPDYGSWDGHYRVINGGSTHYAYVIYTVINADGILVSAMF
ncbi:hypothetical protein EYZ11_013311 [Aspergillus tanneri]|uniref:Cellulose-binding Sde182 nucleoside hydrolase-like domain-containing protein n=1 Tax=Aspergillus tanneri TaxID=1220188 RepID=A0A4S3IY88_9EURO|nr:uncharacterized protein ATNIH1004_003844 [Aspergillus tanneri]KAA8647962.1 hypothetical protein ATNIH1004_003844 [Aspergillus tanneri]THC87245.1 hypothetical protein EYZ11_013311 [Aspergillus tanneri]